MPELESPEQPEVTARLVEELTETRQRLARLEAALAEHSLLPGLQETPQHAVIGGAGTAAAAAEEQAKRADSLFRRGVAHCQSGQYAEAVAAWQEVLRIQPNNAYALANIGIVHTEQGQWPEARRLFARVLELQPENAEAHYGMGMACAQLGDFDRAIAEWEATLRLHPENADARYNIGLVRQRAAQAAAASGAAAPPSSTSPTGSANANGASRAVESAARSDPPDTAHGIEEAPALVGSAGPQSGASAAEAAPGSAAVVTPPTAADGDICDSTADPGPDSGGSAAPAAGADQGPSGSAPPADGDKLIGGDTVEERAAVAASTPTPAGAEERPGPTAMRADDERSGRPGSAGASTRESRGARKKRGRRTEAVHAASQPDAPSKSAVDRVVQTAAGVGEASGTIGGAATLANAGSATVAGDSSDHTTAESSGRPDEVASASPGSSGARATESGEANPDGHGGSEPTGAAALAEAAAEAGPGLEDGDLDAVDADDAEAAAWTQRAPRTERAWKRLDSPPVPSSPAARRAAARSARTRRSRIMVGVALVGVGVALAIGYKRYYSAVYRPLNAKELAQIDRAVARNAGIGAPARRPAASPAGASPAPPANAGGSVGAAPPDLASAPIVTTQPADAAMEAPGVSGGPRRPGRMRVRLAPGMTGSFKYWFVNPPDKGAKMRPLPPPDRSGAVLLEIPAEFNRTGAQLRILNVKQGRVARLPVQDVSTSYVTRSPNVGPNLLANAEFTQGQKPWTFEMASPGKGSLQIEDALATPPGVTGRAVRLDVTAIGKQPWSVQCYQNGVNLADRTPYVLSFWAKADRARPLHVDGIVDKADWHQIGITQTIHVGTGWQKFLLPFTANRVEANHTRISFVLGEATGVIELAGISLRRSEGAARSTTHPADTVITIADRDFN